MKVEDLRTSEPEFENYSGGIAINGNKYYFIRQDDDGDCFLYSLDDGAEHDDNWMSAEDWKEEGFEFIPASRVKIVIE